MIAIATLLLVVAVSLIVTRVATVILVATGMSKATARFQARSALTGTGFTTKEAEDVLNHPIRRKVIATLMLLGSAGVVAAASSTILGLKNGGLRHDGWQLLEMVLGLLALVWVSKSRVVDRWLTVTISALLRRFTDLETRDLAGLLDLAGDYSVAELAVDPSDWVADRSLGELELRDEGVVVLGLTRADGRYIGAPTFATVVRVQDTLTVYGRDEQLAELDDRPAGEVGDAAHRAGVERQQRLERSQEPTPAS